MGPEEERVLAYRAAILLRMLTGWGRRRVWRTLRELGYNVSLNTLNDWFHRGKKPRFELTALEKSLFYHEAHRLVLETKREHPEWSYKRLAVYVSRHLPVKVPHTTVLYWLRGLGRPNVTPVKPCPALGYLTGVLVGDYTRSREGVGLHVKDREFIEYFAEMYEKVTGTKPKVKPGKDGYYHTYERASWLKELWYSGLWKVVAYACPVEFLKGLYDSEGAVVPRVNKKKRMLDTVGVCLATGSPEVKNLAKRILEDLGFEPKEYREPPKVKALGGSFRVFGEYWQLRFNGWDALERFATIVGFREGKRRRRLELLLRIRHLPPRERYREWTKHYEKRNDRWVERGPKPRRAPSVLSHLIFDWTYCFHNINVKPKSF